MQNIADSMGNLIVLAGVSLLADPSGALYWPEQGLLAVADLHLEKGSSFAARGQFLPPYDTPETLSRLARLIAHYAPRCVVALGDSFHDGGGPARLSDEDRGHLHPVARIAHRGRAVSRRCFAADATRMVMPAFGAFTGGLNVRDAAFADLFGTLKFTAHMLGEGRLYAFTAKRCLPD